MPETDARGGTGGGIGRKPRPDSRRRTPPLLPHDHPWKACGSRRSSAPHQRGDGGQDQAGWRYFMTPQSGSQSDMIGSFCRIYSVLLYAYPREFRLQYGAAMQQVFRDRCRDLARTADPLALLRFALHLTADWLTTTVREGAAAFWSAGRKQTHRGFVTEWAVTLGIYLFVTTTLVQAYVIPTGSMEGTLRVGDHMLVDRVTFAAPGSAGAHILPYRELKHGDIVAFLYPEDIRQTYVKRLIGLPGDRIRLDNGRVIRNGRRLTEPYTQHIAAYPDAYRDNFPLSPEANTTARGRDMFEHHVVSGEVIVPPNMLFMLGDNRDNSLDSRYWGFVPRSYVVGKPLFAELTVAMLPGPYRIPAYRGRGRWGVVLPTKTPCGPSRAPGRFEGTSAREHLLDVAATQLGLDPVVLRERNLLTKDEMPHHRHIQTLGTDLVLDPGDYPALLAAAVKEAERLGYYERATGPDHKPRGFGLAMFVEKSGLGPQETADVTVTKSGAVHVFSGGTSLGQGIQTVLAQIAADALGVDPRVVRVVAGDTVAQPFGAGSWASRSTVVGGSAVHQAATAVRERAVQLAARMLEAAEEDLEVRDGSIAVRGDADAKLTLAGVARAAEPAGGDLQPGEPAGLSARRRLAGARVTYPYGAHATLPGGGGARAGAPGGGSLRRGEPAGLSARRRFEVARMTYPYGVHAAVVEVDRETGQVRVLRYLVAYEVGRAINPMLVEGQLRGGVA